jgi:putative Ca2+/H+ antiporter (TMEM165/GDT1 family)
LQVEAFLISAGVVALGEMGDKTQLLAMLLAARFRRPLPIILGILVATLFNHTGAGLVGGWVAQLLGAEALRWVIGLAFIAMAGWMLVPDTVDAHARPPARFGVFGTTLVAFFLAEMGDKTQIATVAADVPAVFVGDRLAHRLPMKLVHGIAAAIFGALGVVTLFNLGKLF